MNDRHDVVREQLEPDLVVLRDGALRADARPELALHRAEHGLDVRPLVVVVQERRPVQREQVVHLLPDVGPLGFLADRVPLEHDVRRRARRLDGHYGVSKDPVERVDGAHCRGGTKTVGHWDCSSHDIEWSVLSKHQTQEKASEVAHKYERTPHKRGWHVFETAGI